MFNVPDKLLTITRRWGGKAFATLGDHAIVSASNFVLSILLARVVSESDYGYFAIAFSIFLFLSGLSQGFILEPLNVLGTVSYSEHPRLYFESAFKIQTLVSLGLALAIGLGGLVLLSLNPRLALTLIGVSLCLPPVLGFLLLRRFYYLHAKPEQAFVGGVAYGVVLLLMLYVSWRTQVLGIVTVFPLMALGSAIPGVLIYIRLRKEALTWKDGSESPNTVSVLRRHWELGRWMVAGAAVGWLCTKIYIPLLGVLAGVEAAAALKAVENLMLPMDQFITSLAVMVTPVVIAKLDARMKYLRTRSIQMGLFFSSCVVLYTGIVTVLDRTFFDLLYGEGSPYFMKAWAVPVLGLCLIMRGFGDAGLGIALRGLERFDVFFKAALWSSVATLTAGVVLVYSFGFVGAVVGKLVSSSVYLMVVLRHFRQTSEAPASIRVIHQIYPVEEFKND